MCTARHRGEARPSGHWLQPPATDCRGLCPAVAVVGCIAHPQRRAKITSDDVEFFDTEHATHSLFPVDIWALGVTLYQLACVREDSRRHRRRRVVAATR